MEIQKERESLNPSNRVIEQPLQMLNKGHSEDDVSGLVQTRFAAEMDNIQFLATTK